MTQMFFSRPLAICYYCLVFRNKSTYLRAVASNGFTVILFFVVTTDTLPCDCSLMPSISPFLLMPVPAGDEKGMSYIITIVNLKDFKLYWWLIMICIGLKPSYM